MFKSKRRPIVIPQSEHARLSGIITSLWGNDDFDKPSFDFQSFVLGVILHDRGYDPLDNKAIGETSGEAWLQTQRDGIMRSCENPIANITTLLHIRRLLSALDSPIIKEHINLANQQIDLSLAKTEHSLADFEWADRITDSCDSTSFAFSFEEPQQVKRLVSPRVGSDETIEVEFSVDGMGLIRAEPWTLSVDRYEGFIMGYELDGYPERLEPVYVPFSIVR